MQHLGPRDLPKPDNCLLHMVSTGGRCVIASGPIKNGLTSLAGRRHPHGSTLRSERSMRLEPRERIAKAACLGRALPTHCRHGPATMDAGREKETTESKLQWTWSRICTPRRCLYVVALTWESHQQQHDQEHDQVEAGLPAFPTASHDVPFCEMFGVSTSRSKASFPSMIQVLDMRQWHDTTVCAMGRDSALAVFRIKRRGKIVLTGPGKSPTSGSGNESWKRV
ncbi:hypothetical protein BCR34DRAFT_591739 [Clohesyomyces aquaticus]|uniref:Uncharacterized protein n=1 Tax=Clohesyomyces aquaticus TaxID=1231657 RepID=A0A1Y1YZD3_9PLEO|nr:hypothetical protein BCR34DRAFT_591739 [Clohesyomyces aquaticus]